MIRILSSNAHYTITFKGGFVKMLECIWFTKLLFSSWQPQARKDYALLLSFVGQARLQFTGLHSLFLALWCIVIEIGGAMMDLLFWCLMYLYHEVICLYRCLCSNWHICTSLIFAVADALLTTDVSALPRYSLLQMLFFCPPYLRLAFHWTCRYFSACLSCTISSTSCLFWDLRILPSQILHLHLTFSITWGCSPSKFCIFNPLESTIADIVAQYPLRSIYFMDWANTLLTKKLI